MTEQEYAITVDISDKVYEALKATIFNRDSELYLTEEYVGENYELFMYAIGSIVPVYLMNRFTKENWNTLDFNHMQNALCFKYMDKSQENEKD